MKRKIISMLLSSLLVILLVVACQPSTPEEPVQPDPDAGTTTEAEDPEDADEAEEQPADQGAEVGDIPTSPLDIMTRVAEGTTITVWTWDSPEFNLPMEEYIYEAAGVYTDGLTIGQADIRDRILASMAAGGVGMPDAFKLNNADIPWLVDAGALLDLTDLVEPYRDLLPQVAWDMVTYQGRIWAIPANSPAGGMFYRYDVLQEFGIDPDELTTWDSWLEAGQRVVTESNGEIHWFSAPRDRMSGAITEAIIQQHRGEILNQDGEVTVNSEEFIAALNFVREIVDMELAADIEDWTAPWFESMREGTVAVYPSGTWFVQTMISQAPETLGLWYFTPFPAMYEGGDRYPNFLCAAVFISSNTDNVEGAFEWCKAWTLDRVGSLDIGLKTLGISVVSNTALSDDFVNMPHEFFARNQVYWREATEAFTNSTYVPPFTLHRQEALNIWGRHFEQWWLREVSTEDLVYQAEQELLQRLR